MFELLRIFWLPLGLTAGILARVPFGTAWFGVLSLFVLGLGIGAIVIDAAIFAAPLAGVLAGRFGYLSYG
jgi:hypothetical protein